MLSCCPVMWFMVLECMKKARQPFDARPAVPRQYAAGAVIYIFRVIEAWWCTCLLLSRHPFALNHYHSKAGYQNTAGVFSPFSGGRGLPLSSRQQPFHHIALRIRSSDFLQTVRLYDLENL